MRHNLLSSPLLAAVACSLLASCSGSFSAIEPFRSRGVGFDGIGSTFEGTSPFARIGAGDVITLRGYGPRQLRVERLSDQFEPRWSTAIEVGGSGMTLAMTPVQYSLVGLHEAREEPPLYVAATDTEIGILTLRYAEPDSVQVRGHRLDARTGAVLAQRTVASARFDEDLDGLVSRFAVALSPDSSRIALYSPTTAGGGRARIVVLRADHGELGRLEAPVTMGERGMSAAIAVDNEGIVSIADVVDDARLRVRRFASTGGPALATSEVALDSAVAGGRSHAYVDLRADMSGGAISLFAIPEKKGMALRVARFDRDGRPFSSSVTPIAPFTLANGHPRLFPLRSTTGAIVVVEQRYHDVAGFHGRPVDVAGTTLLAMIDSTGSERWRQWVGKYQRMGGDARYILNGISVRESGRGSLQTLHYDSQWQTVVLREVRLADGTDVTGGGLKIAEALGATTHVRAATTWLDDDTVLQLLGQGLYDVSMDLYRIEFALPAR